MDALNRSDFMEHFKGRIFLSQFEAVQALSSAKEAPRSRSTTGKESAGRTAPQIETIAPLGHAS
jgi:hypothetical protein